MTFLSKIANYLDKVVGFLGNITIFSSILLASLYFVLPDMRRWVELNLTNRYAWYMVGKLKPEGQRWARYTDDSGEKFKNYYHVEWDEWGTGGKRDITQTVVSSATNSVVVHVAEHNVMGRGKEPINSRDKKKSNNRVISVSTLNECLVPRKFNFVDHQGNKVKEDTQISTVYIWMWAAKVTCN